MKKFIHQFLYKKERGQAIILVAFGIIGLVAMVGLVVDTGILFIEYGKLKRGVDAAAIAAAQQFRSVSGAALDPDTMIDAAKNFLLLNQSGIRDEDISVHSCAEAVGSPGRPALCNQNLANPAANRKLVEVIVSKQVQFSFLRVIGINSTTISTSSVGEAATMDLVMVIDTSASMAFQTTGAPPPALPQSDPGDDPKVCNEPTAVLPCQPLREVKNVASDFIDTMYFPYDRVAIVSMTSQVTGGDRNPVIVLPLNSDMLTIKNTIEGLKVWEPRDCAIPWSNDNGTGTCLVYTAAEGDPGRAFDGLVCPIYENNSSDPEVDSSSCPSSNVGGGLLRARTALAGDPATIRPEAFWAVIVLLGGPANATDPENPADPLDFGYCPQYTWLPPPEPNPPCRDIYPVTTRHELGDFIVYTNPLNGRITDPSYIYDAEDFAMDSADDLANATSETGVTIYTIGLGVEINQIGTSDDYYPDGITKVPPAASLLRYIAEDAGGSSVSHGQYFFAPTGDALTDIFELIANNIATRISQ